MKNLLKFLALGAAISQAFGRNLQTEKENTISNITDHLKLPTESLNMTEYSTSGITRSAESIKSEFNSSLLEEELSNSLKEAQDPETAMNAISDVLEKAGLSKEQIKSTQEKIQKEYEKLKHEGPEKLQNYLIGLVAGLVIKKAKNIAIESKVSRKVHNAFGFETEGQKKEKEEYEKKTINTRLDDLELENLNSKDEKGFSETAISTISNNFEELSRENTNLRNQLEQERSANQDLNQRLDNLEQMISTLVEKQEPKKESFAEKVRGNEKQRSEFSLILPNLLNPHLRETKQFH